MQELTINEINEVKQKEIREKITSLEKQDLGTERKPASLSVPQFEN